MTKKRLVSPQDLADDEDEAPVLTAEWFADAEQWRGDQFIKRGRGRPKLPEGAKELVSLRLEPAVLAKLREAGPGWQSHVNAILKDALGLSQAKQVAGEPADMAARGKTRPRMATISLASSDPGVTKKRSA